VAKLASQFSRGKFLLSVLVVVVVTQQFSFITGQQQLHSDFPNTLHVYTAILNHVQL
jgi:hypothetical protein